jgi:hypothetical protein
VRNEKGCGRKGMKRTRKKPIMTVRRRVPAKAPPIPPITVTALVPLLAWAAAEGVWNGVDVKEKTLVAV